MPPDAPLPIRERGRGEGRSPEDLSRVSRVLQLLAMLAILALPRTGLKSSADKPKSLRD